MWPHRPPAHTHTPLLPLTKDHAQLVLSFTQATCTPLHSNPRSPLKHNRPAQPLMALCDLGALLV